MITTREQRAAIILTVSDIEHEFDKLARDHATEKNRAKQARSEAKRQAADKKANEINGAMNKLRERKTALLAAVETIKLFDEVGDALKKTIDAGRYPAGR